MEDVEREGESDIKLDEDQPTTSVLTITSSEFHRLTIEQEEEEDEEENEQIANGSVAESRQMSPNLIAASNSTTVTGDDALNPHVSAPTLVFDSTWSKPITDLIPFDDSYSNETIIGTEYVPTQQAQLLTDSRSVREKDGPSSDRALPIYYMKLERLKGEEKFDAFSEDEEPVLRTGYTPYIPKQPECPEPVIKEEKIIVYDVREGVMPVLKPKNKKHWTKHDLSLSTSTALFSRSSIARRNTRVVSAGSLDWKFQDLTPHQRDLRNVSYEELSSADVAIIKGLWKCITYNLWTFGALTTINFFRIRGHIAFNDQKATPEEMMQCRFLWPHANRAMKSMEAVVLNLHRPEESHKLVYELGRKHGKLKIPLSEIQSQMVINSFLYTFYQHIHPKMTLKELHILRKFSNITMFLFMDASRWDSEPLLLY